MSNRVRDKMLGRTVYNCLSADCRVSTYVSETHVAACPACKQGGSLLTGVRDKPKAG